MINIRLFKNDTILDNIVLLYRVFMKDLLNSILQCVNVECTRDKFYECNIIIYSLVHYKF